MSHLSERHDVLCALGVRPWYGRYVLPKAAVVPAALLSKLMPAKSFFTVEGVPNIEKDELIPSLATAYKRQEPKAALKEELGVAHIEQLTESVAISDHANKICIPQIEFFLSVRRFGNISVVYEQLNSLDHQLEVLFLDAVMISLNRHESSSDSAALAWPVFKSDVFRDVPSVHFKPLFTRWLNSQAWSGCDYLFYFGKSFQYLESSLLEFKNEKNLNITMLAFEDSLAEIIGSPIKKKNVWELFSKEGLVS